MSNVAADHLEQTNAYRIKMEGAVDALEKLHRQIAQLEIICNLRRAENQDYSQELAELAQQWRHVSDLATMVLEAHDFGKSAYFDSNELEPEDMEAVSETDEQTIHPRKLTEAEQTDLFSQYVKWEEKIDGFKGRIFTDEEHLEEALSELGLECFFETRTPNDKIFRFCRVLWPDPENAGEWVEMAELVIEPTGNSIEISEIFYPTR